jgi:hypothetical protein
MIVALMVILSFTVPTKPAGDKAGHKVGAAKKQTAHDPQRCESEGGVKA